VLHRALTGVSWHLFDQAAARYDAWYDTPRGQRVESAERALLSELPAAFPGAGSLLDVGCGTGRFSAWLAPALRVLGIDRSPGMLTEMRTRHPTISAVLGDAQRLPLSDAAIDLVLFVTTVEFLEDPLAALREAVRVARRGLILIVLNRWSVGGPLTARGSPGAQRPARAGARRVAALAPDHGDGGCRGPPGRAALGEHALSGWSLGRPGAAPLRRCPRDGGGFRRAEP
jgi:SAM-dependent methyltransferase